jgi:flagellar biosynthesis GTPase FlhF
MESALDKVSLEASFATLTEELHAHAMTVAYRSVGREEVLGQMATAVDVSWRKMEKMKNERVSFGLYDVKTWQYRHGDRVLCMLCGMDMCYRNKNRHEHMYKCSEAKCGDTHVRLEIKGNTKVCTRASMAEALRAREQHVQENLVQGQAAAAEDALQEGDAPLDELHQEGHVEEEKELRPYELQLEGHVEEEKELQDQGHAQEEEQKQREQHEDTREQHVQSVGEHNEQTITKTNVFAKTMKHHRINLVVGGDKKIEGANSLSATLKNGPRSFIAFFNSSEHPASVSTPNPSGFVCIVEVGGVITLEDAKRMYPQQVGSGMSCLCVCVGVFVGVPTCT